MIGNDAEIIPVNPTPAQRARALKALDWLRREHYGDMPLGEQERMDLDETMAFVRGRMSEDEIRAKFGKHYAEAMKVRDDCARIGLHKMDPVLLRRHILLFRCCSKMNGSDVESFKLEFEAILHELDEAHPFDENASSAPAVEIADVSAKKLAKPAKSRGKRGVGGKGLKTEFMKLQLRAFERFLSAHGYDGNESRLYALAKQCWVANKRKWDRAKASDGQNKGYSSPKVMADAYKKAM